MPVTPRAARRSSNSRRNEVSLPKSEPRLNSQSLYEPTSVQDRIRQWQAQGAADAPAPDAVSVRSMPLSDHDQDISRPHSRCESPPQPFPQRRGIREPQRDSVDPAGASRTAASAPRKRVISDSHWKSRRGERDENKTTQPQTRTPHHDLSYTSTEAKYDREARKEDRRKSRHSRNHVGSDDDIEARRRKREREVYGLGADSGIDEDLAARLGTQSSTRFNDLYQSKDSTHRNGVDVHQQRSTGYTGPPRRSMTFDSDGDEAATDTAREEIFNTAGDNFPKTGISQLVSDRVPSITAWLHQQPDPFTEQTTLEDGCQSVEATQPFQKPENPTTRKGGDSPADPNSIWSSVTQKVPRSKDNAVPRTPRQRDSRYDTRNGRRASNPISPDDGIPTSEGSPTGLKRSGARSRRYQTSDTPNIGSRETLTPPTVATTTSETEEPPVQPQHPCPPTGAQPLHTIASVETFAETGDPPTYFDANNGQTCTLKRKLTTHEDLMSVLSSPQAGRGAKVTRSLRRSKQQAALSSASEILAALVVEEEKYGRELRTLVDGVIPVLLQCVLSKSDSAAAAGLFTSSSNASDDLNFTKPIIDMGVALERLKSLHGRIPLQRVDDLLIWAQSAQKAYSGYLSAWRLGFQDVVVNLAPLDETRDSASQGMSRDDDGDVIHADGKKVDVAYLLKRPLLRVKNLGKTFECIRDQSDKKLAVDVAQSFADLTAMARRRHQEEQSRLEDAAAANLDVLRARDIRTLAATTGVTIDNTRQVRARDCFNLTLYHSNGQRLDCRIEMIIRDDIHNASTGGDILICEFDDTGKWLLFPPVELSSISARRGEDEFDLVVMIRGAAGIGRGWQELLALKTEVHEAPGEWLNMLGSSPLPPKLNRSSSFVDRSAKTEAAISTNAAKITGQPGVERRPSPDQMDIPIGEPSVTGTSDGKKRRPDSGGAFFERFMPRLNLGGGLQGRNTKQAPPSTETVKRKPVPSIQSFDRSTISDVAMKELPTPVKSSSAPSTPKHASGTLSAPETIIKAALNGNRTPDAAPFSAPGSPRSNDKTRDTNETDNSDRRQLYGQTVSSAPGKELPIVTKVRNSSTPGVPQPSTPTGKSIQDQCTGRSGGKRSSHDRSSRGQIFTEDVPSPPVHADSAKQAVKNRSPRPESSMTIFQPTTKHDGVVLQPRSSNVVAKAPKFKSTPKKDRAKKRRSSSPLKHEYAPSTTSESEIEYDSEGLSDSSSETSEGFLSEHEDQCTPLVALNPGNRRSSKIIQQHYPTVPGTTGTRTLAPSDSASQGPYRKVPSSSTVPASSQFRTVALLCSWSDMGMWEQIHPDECSVVISPGLIEAFELSSATSGVKKSFGYMSGEDADSRASSLTEQPLVAFELTPIVPLRRGTALDISIRSPATANSKCRTTNNVMFRSRNADECESLYNMINWARCNNPTYIQLENARPEQHSAAFDLGDSQHHRRRSGSWFSFIGISQRPSYRASSAPVPVSDSMGAASEAGAGSLANTFTALRRLGVSSAFNINRSSVVRKNGGGQGTSSLYSSSTDTGTGSGHSTPVASQLGQIPGTEGPRVPPTSAAAAGGGGMINNMKIRLYLRKGQHWENLGAGRLTVLPATDTTPPGSDGAASFNRAANSAPSSPTAMTPVGRPSSSIFGQPGQMRTPRLASSGYTPHRVHGDGREKRIVVTKNPDSKGSKKTDDQAKKNADGTVTLLDAVLGESCFERVMQTGIAVKVWSEEEMIGVSGGVLTGREKVYMMQFPGTKEAGWVFQMCGSYRYGD